jgi:hypothetical protein
VFLPKGKGFQIFAEAIYGNLTRYDAVNGAYRAQCTYYGLEGGVQVPLDFVQP